MSRGKRKLSHEGPFILHTLEMRQSPAWVCLPDNARRVLDRLEVEHACHGGAENGKLVCTYSDFAKAGIRRASIALAVRQCVALGFLEVRVQGARSISNERWPSRYRLTYVLGVKGSPDPTHDWRRFETVEGAHAAAAMALSGRNLSTQVRSKFKKPDAKTSLEPDAKTLPDWGMAGRENAPPRPDAKTRHLSISRGGRTGSSPQDGIVNLRCAA